LTGHLKNVKNHVFFNFQKNEKKNVFSNYGRQRPEARL